MAESNMSSLSRVENILRATLGYEDIVDYDKRSRVETLLIELKETIEAGSGDGSAYAHSLELTIDSQTYVMTATLKNTSGEALGTPQTIDLPLETMVVGGSYDDTTKKVILTLKNGNTVDFSVADLVSGLQTEITSSNKLNSDLVDDTNQNNKFVTSAEKTKIANALTEEVYNAGKTVKKGTKVTINGKTYTVEDYAEIFNNLSSNKAVGICSHAEGSQTTAIAHSSHAEGSQTTASGLASHAEGSYTTASGNYSHAEGYSTTASGKYSHAEGYSTTAIAHSSHAEGYNTEANGDYSHAEGSYTTASGNYSHAEGYSTTASGKYSHAEGSQTTASSDYSHAEGYNTEANGDYSHAEGYSTEANGKYSHAEGYCTIADSNNQHVQGKYNIATIGGKYAFIIGNGTDSNNRSNAFAIDWDGKIYVGNSSTGVDVSDLLARITPLETISSYTLPIGAYYSDFVDANLSNITIYTVGNIQICSGRVFMKERNTSTSTDTIVFTLPDGYRPSEMLYVNGGILQDKTSGSGVYVGFTIWDSGLCILTDINKPEQGTERILNKGYVFLNAVYPRA